MYIPPHFSVPDAGELARVVRTHPLGMLVRHTAAGLDADHIPFEFDPSQGARGKLSAHVARANPVWKELPAGSPVMVVFRGAEAFVSPSWYPSKHETHRQVPTWNYEVVHVHGSIHFYDDERFVRGMLARLTRRHEASEAKPWKMSDSSPEFIDQLLANIVGLEVEVTSIVGKAKLSQNRDERDRLEAAEILALRGHQELADRMRTPHSPRITETDGTPLSNPG
jgi:transcriptional regulator